MRLSLSRLTLTTTFIIGASVLSLTQPAVAARTLAPMSDWTINDVAVDGGQGYCTMAREYEANSVVTFAKNSKNEGTIAFDFQRDVFDLTRSYPITLQAGSVVRQYAVRPANNSAIIMRTSTDASLFQAMEQAGALNVTIDNEVFTIDLSGYIGAFDELARCSGFEDMPAAPVASVASSRPSPTPSSSTPSNPVVAAAIKDKPIAGGGVPSAPSVAAQRPSTPQVSNQAYNNVQAQLSKQDAQMDMLISENAKLVRTLEDERTAFRNRLAQQQEIQERQLESARQASATQATAQENELLTKLAEAESSNAELLRRIASLEERLVKASNSVNPDMAAALKERNEQIALLIEDKNKIQQILDAERAKRVEMTAELADQTEKAEDAAYTESLTQNLENQIASLQAQNSDLKIALETERSKAADVVVKEIEVPVEVVREVKVPVEVIKEVEVPVEVIKEVVREVPVATGGTTNPELEGRLAEAETAALTARAERDEYRALLQRERARLKEMNTLGEQINSVDSGQSNMTETIRRLEEEKVNLIRQLEFAKRGGDVSGQTADMASTDTNVNALQARIDEVARESDQAKEQLRMMAAEKYALEAQLSETKIQLAQARRETSSNRAQQMAEIGAGSNTEIRTLESEIAALEAQNLALREDLAARTNRSGEAAVNTNEAVSLIEDKYAKRFAAMEEENIRLTKALASERASQQPSVQPTSQPPVKQVEAQPQEIAEVAEAPEVEVISQVPAQRISEPVDMSSGEIRRENVARLRNKITGKPIEIPTQPAAVQTQMAQLPQPAPQLQVAPAPQQPAPLMQAAIKQDNVQPAPQPQIQASQPQQPQRQMVSLSGDEIKQLVLRSQIPMATQIERVSNVSGPDFAAFRWDTGQVYGSAEQSTMPNSRAFQQSVNQYIQKTQSRCQGTFDQTPVPVQAANGVQASAVDIACIDNGMNGAAASILFFASNGMFYAVAMEAGIEDFQTAMDMRDRLANSLSAVF